MTNSNFNRQVLEEVFPIECELVGSENMDDICEGHVEFMDSEAAYRMDVGQSVALLANAVTIIAFVWSKLQERPRQDAPKPSEMDELVIKAVKESKSINGNQRQEIYIALRRRSDAQQD